MIFLVYDYFLVYDLILLIEETGFQGITVDYARSLEGNHKLCYCPPKTPKGTSETIFCNFMESVIWFDFEYVFDANKIAQYEI